MAVIGDQPAIGVSLRSPSLSRAPARIHARGLGDRPATGPWTPLEGPIIGATASHPLLRSNWSGTIINAVLSNSNTMIGIALALLLAVSDSPDMETSALEVTVCPIELTELGRRARFNFNWIYVAETDAKGQVVEVRRLDTRSRPPFVKESEFEPCIRSWHLNPKSEFIVVLAGGTTLAPNSITVSGESLRLVLRVPK